MLLLREADEFPRLGEQGEHVPVGKGQFQARVAVEHLLDLGPVVPAAQPVVVAPVGHGFNDARHGVGGEFRDDGRRRNENLFRRHADDERKERVQDGVVEHGHGNGQHAAEEIADDGRPREAAVDVVRGYVDAVGQRDDGKDQERSGFHVETEHAAEQQIACEPLQQDDGNARVHERVADSRPVHEVLP